MEQPEEKPKLTEVDLARYIVRYFQDLQWEVYQEVQIHQQSSRADLVITQGHLVGVVECKQSLGLPVLEQAFCWQPYAHFVWVATWYQHRNRSQLAWRIMKDYGLGYVSHPRDPTTAENNDSRESIEPRLLRKPPLLDLLREKLRPEHQLSVAGGNRGGHWTPFRHTCHELARIVEASPGITLKDALEQFKHHYSNTRSAMGNLPEWIDKGKVPGVRLDRSDGRLRLVLQPKEAVPEKA